MTPLIHRQRLLFAGVFLLALTHAIVRAAATSAASQVALPPETAAFVKNDLPGYALVQRNCLMCHSAQYVTMQPPSSARPYWDATVKKMKKPFGAPFPDDDIPAMVEYLVRTYGAERAAPAR